MEPREAIVILKRMYKGTPTTNQCIAFEMAYEALDKQIPIEVTDVHVDEYYCPACGSENSCDQKTITDNYCPICGQRIYQSRG